MPAAIGLIKSGAMQALDGSVRFMAVPVEELLWNGEEKARLVQRNFKPVMTKQEYLKNWCNL